MPLLSTSQKTTALAPALPISNRVFDQLRLYLRQGQFTILASAPSVGKSVFARNLVVKTKIPSLFFSADSDEYTVKTSVLGAVTQRELVEIERNLQDDSWEDYYNEHLRQADHVEWSFNTDITLDYIEQKLEAYAEMYGDYPKLTVIDNLSDMLADADGDVYIELRRICRELRAIARNTHCHVIALHHLTGEYEDGMKQVTLKALEGKVGKIPENVLGLNWTPHQTVEMTVPKARGTKRGMAVPISLDYSKALVSDFR